MDCGGEIPEMVEVHGACSPEGAQLDFVVIAGVEQGDRPAFVEPLFEFVGREFGRGALGGVDARDPEGDDFLFEPDEQPGEGLVGAFAVFGGEPFKAGALAQGGQQRPDTFRRAGHEQIDAFGAEQDGPLEAGGPAEIKEFGPPLLQTGEVGELVGSDIRDGRHGFENGPRMARLQWTFGDGWEEGKWGGIDWMAGEIVA